MAETVVTDEASRKPTESDWTKCPQAVVDHMTAVQAKLDELLSLEKPCPRCKGNGRVELLEHCPLCCGAGTVTLRKYYEQCQQLQQRVAKLEKKYDLMLDVLEEYTNYQPGIGLIPPEKPRHGNCCTCQTCGRDHDSCVCTHNEIYTILHPEEQQ